MTAASHAAPVRSADELRHALRQSRVRPVPLDLSGLDRILCIESGRGRIEVQACTPWRALADHPALADRGLDAFAGLAGFPATVGEALARNAAGPDGLPVGEHVLALALATPDGELKRGDRASGTELLRQVNGGQHLSGALYSVTFDLAGLARSAAAAEAPVELHLPEEAPAQGPACELELLLPPERLEDFLAQLRAQVRERRLALHNLSVRRTLPATVARLSWATREWAQVRVRFGIRGSLGSAVYAAETRRELLALALGCGGSFPAADLRDATRAQLLACYPGFSAVLAEARPADAIPNAWLRRARAILRGEACESRWGG